MSKSKLPKSKLREEEDEFSRRRENKHQGSNLFPEDDEDESHRVDDENRDNTIGSKKRENDEQYDASTPPAWTAMQRSLGIVTPYLPLRTRGHVQKRYELLRPHLPQTCILLPDIHGGSHDLKVCDPNLYLCVWVDSIEERNSHHGIWTVELKDETGATIRAWMEPNFVKEELRKAQQIEETASSNNNSKGVVRVGVVWMLANFTMIAINANNINNSSSNTAHNGTLIGSSLKSQSGESVERMLVVSKKHILRVWTPESDRAQNQPNEDEDSPEAQRKYLDWMEQRNALTDHNNNNKQSSSNDVLPPEMEEEEMEEEEAVERQEEARIRRLDDEQTNDDDRSSRCVIGGKDWQERMTEMSALTMTFDDEIGIVTSQRDNGRDCHRSATNEMNESGIPPTAPLAHRNVNQRESRIMSVNNGSGRKNRNGNNLSQGFDENHTTPSVLLHTQESTHVKDRMEGKSGRSEHGSRIDRDITSSLGLSPQKHRGDHSDGKVPKRKKDEKDEGVAGVYPVQDRAMNIDSPKQSRGIRSSTCRSPIRMSQSVWDTPDPSILKMLEDEDDHGSVEEEEVKTVIWEEPSPSPFNTQSSNNNLVVPETSHHSKTETITPGGSKGCESGRIDNGIDSRPDSTLLTERILLGQHAFDPSNWVGMDATIFNASDSE
jgi:hypothetical protein